MRILVTGANGFVGRNILESIKMQFDSVCTLGLSEKNDVVCDLSVGGAELSSVTDVVLHMCGAAHGSDNVGPDWYSRVNVDGTRNLCRGLERIGLPKYFVFLSTCAVYGSPFGIGVTEDHPLNGKSPYAKSKIQAEMFLTEWCSEHGVVLSILRPSLIVGKGAKGTLASMENAVKKGYFFNIDGGTARKSLLMAEDIARVLPLVMKKGGVYNLCDTYALSFYEISEMMARKYGRKTPHSIPRTVALMLGGIGDLMGPKCPVGREIIDKMTVSVTFSNEKARSELGWDPICVKKNFEL